MEKNPYIHLFLQLRRLAPDKKLFFRMLIFSVIGKLLWLTEPYRFGQLINTIQLQGVQGRNNILRYLSIFSGIGVIAWVFHGLSRIREQQIQFKVSELFLADIFSKIGALPMAWHSDNHSGETIDKVSKANAALKDFAGDCHMHRYAIINIIGSLIGLTLIRRPAGVIVICFSVVMAWVVHTFDMKLVHQITEKNKKEHLVMSSFFDFLSNIKTVIALRFEDRALHTLRSKVAEIYPVFRGRTITNERKWFSVDIIMKIVVFLIVTAFLWHEFSTQGVVLIGTITMVRQYIDKMSGAIDNFNWIYGDIMQKSTDFHSIDEIVASYNTLPSRTTTHIFDQTHPIHIQDLHFSYTNQDNQKIVLNGINVTLHPGERIALVGASGSGKSTLMTLLRGLYPVDHVQLTIGDTTFDTLEPLSHYAALIPQEPEIFEQTIRYNITMGIDIDDATVQKYLEIACFDDVVATLPHGLDTDIKEKGVNLSGGQKQRLALTRGLLMSAHSRILLLDESTSSVDIHNEKRIYEHILKGHPETCIVASIHKLHLLPFFDMIYLIDEGKVMESGSFTNLTQDPNSQLSKLRADYLVDTIQHVDAGSG